MKRIYFITITSQYRIAFNFPVMWEVTFRFSILVVQFVQFFVIRCCEAAFRGDVYDQAHVIFVSKPTRDDITSFPQRNFTRSGLCLLGQRDFLSPDGVRREVINRHSRFVILVSAHRCYNCNRWKHWKFSMWQIDIGFALCEWQILLITVFF